MKNRATSPILFFILLLANPALSQTIVTKKLDSVLAALSKSTDPGFAVAVVQQGEIKYSGGFGMADLAKQKKNTVNTPFNIASASKQFTAACIYLLEQQGKLKTSDKLSKYFHDFPAYADTITIAHLIHHQSGLRDFTTLLWLKDMKLNSAYADSDAYTILTHQKSLNFHPGDDYSYTNSGYFLLALIVKQVSGQDLQEYAAQHIFKPLKMNHTGFLRNHKAANKANGYIFNGKIFTVLNPSESTIGHSHVYSIAPDWQKWFLEMKDHKVLGDSVWKNMIHPGSTKDGKVTDYAGGLMLGDYKDKATIFHGGDLYGYHSKMTWFPKEELGIIVLINNDELTAESILGAVYHTMYQTKKQVAAVKPEVAAVQATIKIDTNRYTGTYRNNGNSELNFEVTVVGSKLNVNQLWNQVEYPITAVNDSLFYIDGNENITFTFQDAIAGKTSKLTISQNNKLSHYSRLMAKTQDPESIKTYLGRYYNDEIDAYYTVFWDAGNLKIKIGESEFKTVRTGEKENYNIIGNGMNFTFHKDKNGKIDGLDLVHIRVSGLHFVKS